MAKFTFHGEAAELKHGSVVIAAITSCTNTSNPSVMLGAALVAKKAYDLGLQVCSDSCVIHNYINRCILFGLVIRIW